MADNKHLLHTKAEIVKSESDNEDGIIEAVVASTSVLDRQGDVIDQSGWDLNNFKKNPVILWGHNVREERPPIGKALKTWVEGEGKKAKLMFKTQFDMGDAFAADIYRKVKEGFINMVSVGFMPTEWEPISKDEPFGGNKFLAQELLEISFVPVPANPQAAVQIRSLGKDIEPIEEDKLYPEVKDLKDLKSEPEEDKKEDKDIDKGVIPFKATNTDPETAEWDAPGEIAKAETSELKKMCAWFDAENPDVKSSYKLPHHRAGNGNPVVWRGVAAAMASLLGARGGVTIPDEDRKGVYNHLVKHYKQFDKTAPEFRYVEEQVLKGLTEEIGVLMLEHDDKYEIRLLKKALNILKEQQKTHIKTKSNTDVLVAALDVVDKGVTSAIKQIKEGKGGE